MPVLLAALALLALAPVAAQGDVSFAAKGHWTCDNRGTVVPVAGARVELSLRVPSWYLNVNVARAHTAADGSFHFDHVRVPSGLDVSVELVLNDDTGVKLGDWYSLSDWDTRTGTTHIQNGLIDFGTYQISRDGGKGTPKCAVWQGAHNAYRNFVGVTGLTPPDPAYSISSDFPCCGVPFTTLERTRWPSGYETGDPNDPDDGYSVNFHEFAHSVRHSYDGGSLHFFYDAARFAYLQHHNPLSVTNPGFAFNEGWAEYWAKTTMSCPDSTDFSCEGNVATALAALERCANRATMTRVLRENPEAIHSLSEFEARFFAIVPRAGCVLGPVVAPGGLTNVGRTLSAGQQTTALNGQIAAERNLIAVLNRRRLRSAGPCTAAVRCVTAVERLTAPAALDAQIAQAKLVLARLHAGLATAGKARFRPDLADLNALDASRRAFDRANQAIVLRGLKAGMRAVEARGPHRVKATAEFRRLRSRAALLTRAHRRGTATPARFASLFSAPAPPIDVARRTRG